MEFNAGVKNTPAGTKFITADGKFHQAENISVPIELDGSKLITFLNRNTGAQSVYARIKWSGTPTGAIFSQHRTMENFRGYEAGFSQKYYFDLEGTKFAMQISSGRRDSIISHFDKKAAGIVPNKEYDCFAVITPGKSFCFTAIDVESRKVVLRQATAAPQKLAPKAGERLLCIGGRRISSKKASCFAPAGTAVSKFAFWNRALSEQDICQYIGYKTDFQKIETSVQIPVRSKTTLYVNGSTGNDKNDGLSREKSFKTIQCAANNVQKGDTVIIAEGVYYEKVCLTRAGSFDNYITFKGEGKVIITAADRKLRERKGDWKLEDKEKNIYSVPFDHDPVRVLADGYELFPYPVKECLPQAAQLNGYPSTPHGFAFDEKEQRLYVRFKAGQTPEKTMICASPERAAGSNGHHVWQSYHANFHIGKGAENGYIILDNLTFETPGGAGVVTCGSNIVVRNCVFSGCRFGVAGFKKADNIFIENCDYSQKGVYKDVMDVIKRAQKEGLDKKFRFYFWGHKSNRNSKKQMSNFETGIVCGVGRNWHLRNCRIDDSFEGFSCWCANEAVDFQVYGNMFRKIIDNAIETENKAKNVRVYNNCFEDVFEPVSWQPLAGPPWPGPVFVYRNIVRTTEAYKLHATAIDKFLPGAFKIGVAGRNWHYPKHGNVPIEVIAARTSKRFVGAPDPGFLVFNNTILHPEGGLMTTPQPVSGRALRELVNFRFFNNIIQTKKMNVNKVWKAPLVEFYNNMVVDSKDNDAHRGIMSQDGGKLFKNIADLKLAADHSLAKESPARMAGILHFEEPDASLDCGAVPWGTKFDLTCGAGSASDLSKLSKFRKSVNYHPEFIRSLGPERGSWAIYSFDKIYNVPLEIPSGAKSLTAVFRITDCTRPHENITRKWKLFSAENFLLQIETNAEKSVLVCQNGSSKYQYDLGKLERDVYQTLTINFSKEIILNGKTLTKTALKAPAQGEGKTEIYRNVLFDLEIR